MVPVDEGVREGEEDGRRNEEEGKEVGYGRERF